MRRFAAVALTGLFATLAPSARADLSVVPPVLEIFGNVTNAARPVANALVIALNLKDLGATQTYTSTDGTFKLPSMPAGIYKVIAVKQGLKPAIATILPGKPYQRVKLAMQNEKKPVVTTDDEMWEIRASLPPDILHEVDQVLAAASLPDYRLPRLRGEMVSMTAVGDQPDTPMSAQTSLGVQSRLTDSWQLGVRGNIHRIDDPTDATGSFGTPAAQSSVMSMELRSNENDSYRLASTKSFWRLRGDTPETAEADVRTHNFEWEHGDAKVQVRYFAQENLFASAPGSDLIEVSGGTTLMQTRHSDLGVSIRVQQESVRNTSLPEQRMADVTTTGSYSVVPALLVRYGVSSRVALTGTEVAPRTGAEWKFGKKSAFVVGGMYKVMDSSRDAATALPSVVVWSEDGRVLPRYAYSFGIVSGDENSTHLSAIATVTAVESPLRMVVTDGSEQFWDGLYIDSGDVRRDLRVSCRKDLGNKLAIDVSASGGEATPAHGGAAKVYVTADVQSIFFPTGTSLIISYRNIDQPQFNRGDYRSERVNVRMAQSLHLPLDLKVLLGIEMARAANSPYLLDTFDTDGTSRKFVGGLAVNF